MKTIVVWILIIVAVVVIWKYAAPRLRGGDTEEAAEASATGGGGGASCVKAARAASERWGSGLGQFVNPPYDLEAWSMFSGDVNSAIDTADSLCSCEEDSCAKAGEAMRELRQLVSEIDNTMRNNARPPDDMVQRQEAIDNKIEAAAGGG